MPVYDYLFLLDSDTAFTTAAVSGGAADFGVAYPDVQAAGQFGMHVIVTTTFTSLTEGVRLIIVHSAADDLSTSSEEHTSMFVPVTELAKGAHFFIPLGNRRLLRYACGLWKPVSTSGASGKITWYFGDREPLSR